MDLPPKIVGPWKLKDIDAVPDSSLQVFSCFSCCGGSTMGYKLAGIKVIGCNEIDPEIINIYKINHNPKYAFHMPIQEFKEIEIPKELIGIDILDGSPPCSSFSMAGNREKDWGKKKKFREGQAVQVLDDLFFHFIDLGKRIQPKVIIAENVKGMIMGKAKGYVKQVFRHFREIGYIPQLFLLDSSEMGVPQKRQRVFFIARQKDLPPISLKFNEPIIPVIKAIEGCSRAGTLLSDAFRKWWSLTPKGKSFSVGHPKGSFFNSHRLHPLKPSPTVTATTGAVLSHWDEPRKMSDEEVVRLQTFPDDFDFNGSDVKYICGMSVPPLMMQRLALQIRKQIFKK